MICLTIEEHKGHTKTNQAKNFDGYVYDCIITYIQFIVFQQDLQSIFLPKYLLLNSILSDDDYFMSKMMLKE